MNSQLAIAAHILAVLAHHKDQGAVTSDVLAKGFGTSPVVIRRVLAQLKKADLVKSRKGVGGGSVLAKPADEITLRDAYTAVTQDTDSFLTRHPSHCEDGLDITPIIAEYLNELFVDAENALLQSLESATVFDLTQEIARRFTSADTQASSEGK